MFLIYLLICWVSPKVSVQWIEFVVLQISMGEAGSSDFLEDLC